MLKKISIGLLALMFILSCGHKEAAEEGNDLTLTNVINIKDLPVLGPITIQETEMFSGNIMRSMISTSINLAGEQQEISSTFLINLDKNRIYFINDVDSTYSELTFPQFDSMLAAVNMLTDTAAGGLQMTSDMVQREDSAAKVIGQFGECVPVKFDLVLTGTDTTAHYQSKITGEMWLSNSIRNEKLFVDFQKNSSTKFENSLAGNAAFFGMAGSLKLGPEWFKKINQEMTGIPVQAEFNISMPVGTETVNYGITMNLENYTTANINKTLFEVPAGYKQVAFSNFEMY